MKFAPTTDDPIEPRCPHFGICGGCKIQHISYFEQLEQKKLWVESLFGYPSLEIIGCDPPWRYRNKMEFTFSQDRKGEKFLGLLRKAGRVENLESCDLVSPWFTHILDAVRTWWKSTPLEAYHPPSNRGALRTLTLREGIHTNERMVFITLAGDEEIPVSEFASAVGEVDTLLVRRQHIAKKTPTYFTEEIVVGSGVIHEVLHDEEEREWKFRLRAASFFQPNTRQAEILYQRGLELLDLEGSETLLDLYCGTGSLGIFASRKAEKVLGIELLPDAVEDARVNIQANGVENMEVLQGDVGTILQNEKIRPDAVILDPPRVGLCAATIRILLEMRPKKILYISCNPRSQADNCARLMEGGYKLAVLQPVDQFPHTLHVENIVLLTLST
ncbi:MAG: 23S rRNA (uracil-C(5))-methyltransferase RlmCD [Chlamydiae bacterium]|nr:23S rRNA (uracil-C(5))-methyltransferase RlmCD [Chlamydiota bacterium]